MPIESQFLKRLPDNLNAEIVLGTVSNIQEATQWLRYTYFFQRVMKNPLGYGIAYDEEQNDPNLEQHRRKLIIDAAKTLHKCNMIRCPPHTLQELVYSPVIDLCSSFVWWFFRHRLFCFQYLSALW